MTATAFVEGVALWAPTLPGWAHARAAFRDGAVGAEAPAPRPSPALLPAAERRRAPDTVALALEVAAHAVAQSGLAAGELLSVFTSAHADLDITDAICRALVSAPTLLSPTRFLNSVHNAASGHWGIATGCMRASSAVTAFDCSFAAGLLEALTQCAAESRPVLLVGCDIEARGALASTNASRGQLAVALVIAPQRSPRTLVALDWALQSGPAERAALRSAAAQALGANAMADALPLFEALAYAGTRCNERPLPGWPGREGHERAVAWPSVPGAQRQGQGRSVPLPLPLPLPLSAQLALQLRLRAMA